MPSRLRTATPMGDWRTLKFTASVDVVGIKDGEAAGTSYLYNVNDTLGAVLESAKTGSEAVLIYHAEKILVPKKIGQGEDFGLGERVWWDPVARTVTPTQAKTYWLVGIATENAGTTDTYVEIDLDGAAAILGDEID